MTIILDGTSGVTTPGVVNTAGQTIATTLAVTGTITPSQTAGIVGTTTNNDVNAGSVGEFIDSAATNVTVGTTATNLTSISLTAGDWDVSGIVQFYGGGTVTYVTGAINTTSASLTGTVIGKSQIIAATYSVGGIGAATLPSLRFILASTTTIYLIGVLSASQQCYGYISARRVR
jgi:hypothetical protein